MVTSRHRFFYPAVEVLVLEEEHAVLIANSGLEQSLRIARRSGVHHLDSRRVQKHCFRILRVERSTAHVPATRTAHDHRTWEHRAITRGRDIVREHVVATRYEVDELHL